MTRDLLYVVLGPRGEVDAWRRQRRLYHRHVVSACSPHKLRGLTGPIAVVTLPSWSQIREKTRASILADLTVLRRSGSIVSETTEGAQSA